jgi:hypothetical protein
LENSDVPASAPVSFETIKPVESEADNKFFGFVSANEELEATIRLFNRTDRGIDVKLESIHEFESKIGHQIRLEPGLNKIPITWSASSTVGRNEFMLSIVPVGYQNSIIQVQLSWIVEMERE